jgi:hypothetical protein
MSSPPITASLRSIVCQIARCMLDQHTPTQKKLNSACDNSTVQKCPILLARYGLDLHTVEVVA